MESHPFPKYSARNTASSYLQGIYKEGDTGGRVGMEELPAVTPGKRVPVPHCAGCCGLCIPELLSQNLGRFGLENLH